MHLREHFLWEIQYSIVSFTDSYESINNFNGVGLVLSVFFPKKILICHVYNSRYPQQKKTIKTTDIYIIAGVVIFQAQSKSVWKG